jgi:hypothetical protein
MFIHSNETEDTSPITCDYCDKTLRSDTGKSGYGQLKVHCKICDVGPLFQSQIVPHMIQVSQEIHTFDIIVSLGENVPVSL